ncbi:MAG: ABC-F family ATP-binding cassette domain-containing protein [Anaerostipes sp.]|nr:ABC-F family ATP-binding cassette domain-containing protein [Anaerostipes sp.]
MNILNIEHISKTYGDKVIFDDISLGIHSKDKIGVIGVNGTGKTTLLKMIAGLESKDAGEVICSNGKTIAYLPQNPEFPEEGSILSYVVKGKKDKDWDVESQAKTILTKLGIYEFERPTKNLSGGEKKRVALARTLVAPADILILDEPTNHIDNDMVRWLEEFLLKFNGVLIMVTHDRFFLDRVTNKIVEIDHGKLYSYDANYSGFLDLKTQREEMEIATERKRQSILRVEKEWIMRGPQGRGTKQRARKERYEKLLNTSGSREKQSVEMDSVESRLGKKTIEANNISKSFGEKLLVKDFTHIFLRNERIGIIGKNGAGKSTLIKILIGREQPDGGSVDLGETVKVGYFAQECESMKEDIRVIDYIKDVADYIQTATGQTSASQMLERFLFTPEMQYTPIEKLSGGERRRLYLLRVLMGAPNVLILDEPTNDLDIETLTILEDYLDSFHGIVITVSHDRYFLDRVVDRILSFEGNGHLQIYEGGYTEYMEKKEEEQDILIKQEKSNKKEEYRASKEKKLKFTYMEKKEFETIDDDIESLETKIQETEEEMLTCVSQYSKLTELTEKKEELENQLELKMERWEYLNDLAERIKNQE